MKGLVRNSGCCSARFMKRVAMGIRQGVVMLALTSAFLVAWVAMASAQTYTVLHSFAGSPDGADPQAPVTLDTTTGNLYGVTIGGGSGCSGCGTVFEIAPAGVESVLYSFCSQPNCADGVNPIDVLLDANGNLFGTAFGGAYGYGAVFKVDPNGVEKVLHSFKGGADGENPSSGLIRDPNTGDFYGVTRNGGAYDNEGTVYKITATGTHTVLYSFGPGSGGGPAGKLVEDGNTGNLYGTQPLAGGCGLVFELTPAGVETTFYLFGARRGDACEPGPGDPGLVMDAQGNLFGTTVFGGTVGWGAVFELTAGGVEKVLYSFKGPKKGDGAWPQAGLVLDESTGNLYGTTDGGGTGQCWSGCGTIFELSPPAGKHGRWRETILYSFTGGADGYIPLAGLIRDAETGDLYGTAQGNYKKYNWGVVFKLTP